MASENDPREEQNTCINCDGPLASDGLCPICNVDTPKEEKISEQAETFECRDCGSELGVDGSDQLCPDCL